MGHHCRPSAGSPLAAARQSRQPRSGRRTCLNTSRIVTCAQATAESAASETKTIPAFSSLITIIRAWGRMPALDLQPAAGPFRNRPAQGLARVLCYSPRHNVTLAELELSEIENLLAAWRAQYEDLGSRPEIQHVLIFENKGEVVGVSNPHPHCQIYATNFVFKTIENEAAVSRRHYAETGRRSVSGHPEGRTRGRPADYFRKLVGDCFHALLCAIRLRMLRRS